MSKAGRTLRLSESTNFSKIRKDMEAAAKKGTDDFGNSRWKDRQELYDHLSEVVNLDTRSPEDFIDWFDETVDQIADKLKLKPW